MPFSNLSVRKKFLIIDIMVVLAVILTWMTMLSSISKTKEEKYKQMEMTAITASDKLLSVSLEYAFSIAKNIYTNEAMYEFLNTEYPSSAAYYEAYYPLQRSTAMNTSDISIVRNCTIYTSNPTILTGGNLKQLDSAVGDYWYKAFKKMGKPIILCIDPDNGSMKLVRKLDYIDINTGDSFLCVELNTDEIANLADNIGFDGELYIMSGSNLIYSSDKSAKTADDIEIKPDFECVTRNYYTTDIEFYSCSHKTKMKDFLTANKILLTGLLIVVVTLERGSNQILAGPDIVSRGFVYVREAELLIEQCKDVASETLYNCLEYESVDWSRIKNRLREDLGSFLWERTKRSPMILPIISEV